MLDVLREAPLVRDAAAKLADEYGVPAEEIAGDLINFCDELAGRGLIERASAAS
jgi:hypothetical protein